MRKKKLMAGEVTHWLKFLTPKHEDLSSDSPEPTWLTGWYGGSPIIPALEGYTAICITTETIHSRELWLWQWHCVSETKGRAMKMRTPTLGLHIHVHTCTHATPNVCPHTAYIPTTHMKMKERRKKQKQKCPRNISKVTKLRMKSGFPGYSVPFSPQVGHGTAKIWLLCPLCFSLCCLFLPLSFFVFICQVNGRYHAYCPVTDQCQLSDF